MGGLFGKTFVDPVSLFCNEIGYWWGSRGLDQARVREELSILVETAFRSVLRLPVDPGGRIFAFPGNFALRSQTGKSAAGCHHWESDGG